MWLLKFFIVAISVGLGDMCWTKYFMKVAEKKALGAGFWSAMIMVCGAVSIFGYLDDRRYILAAIIGAFFGTYLTVKKSK